MDFRSFQVVFRSLWRIAALGIAIFGITGTLGISSSWAQGIDWRNDVAKAKKQAVLENKIVLLHFGAHWSRSDKNLTTFVYSQPGIKRTFQANVIAVKIDADANETLVREYGVENVPFDVVLSPQGRVLAKRGSPLDATAYRRMLERYVGLLSKNEATGRSKIANDITEIKELIRDEGSQYQGRDAGFGPKPFLPTRGQKGEKSDAIANVPPRKVGDRSITSPVMNSNGVLNSMPTPTHRRFVKNPFVLPSPDSRQQTIRNETSEIAARPEVGSAELGGFNSQSKATAMRPAIQKSEIAAPVLTENPVQQSQKPSQGAAFVVAGSPLAPTENNGWKPRADTTEFVASVAQTSSMGDGPDPVHAGFATPANEGFISEVPSEAVTVRDQPEVEVVEDEVVEDDSESTEVGASPRIVPLAKKDDSFWKPSVKTELLVPKSTAGKFALDGKCPVTLLTQSMWIDGDKKWGCVHRNQTYLFSSEANLKLFQTDPDAYSPILAGHDPVVFHETGQLSEGKEQHGVFMGSPPHQRIVLFRNAANRDQFQKEPLKYLDAVRQAMKSNGGKSSAMLR